MNNIQKIFSSLLNINAQLEEEGGIPFTGKSFFKEKNQGGGELKSRSIEDVVNSLRKLFIKNKIIHWCSNMEMMECDRKTRIMFTYNFKHIEDGSELILKSIGESKDGNDTCIQSANSYALKNALLNLVLMTGRTFEEDDVTNESEDKKVNSYKSNYTKNEYASESGSKSNSDKFNNFRFVIKRNIDASSSDIELNDIYNQNKSYINKLQSPYKDEVLGWFSDKKTNILSSNG